MQEPSGDRVQRPCFLCHLGGRAGYGEPTLCPQPSVGPPRPSPWICAPLYRKTATLGEKSEGSRASKHSWRKRRPEEAAAPHGRARGTQTLSPATPHSERANAPHLLRPDSGLSARPVPRALERAQGALWCLTARPHPQPRTAPTRSASPSPRERGGSGSPNRRAAPKARSSRAG